MLLNLLSKEEKNYFIDLLKKTITVDGPVNDIEKSVISKLQGEMGEDISKFFRFSTLTTEKLIEYFASKPKGVKNIVFYNLFAASLIDDFYSVEEHLLLEQIQEAFGIPNKTKVELCKLVYAERDLKEKIKRMIIE